MKFKVVPHKLLASVFLAEIGDDGEKLGLASGLLMYNLFEVCKVLFLGLRAVNSEMCTLKSFELRR